MKYKIIENKKGKSATNTWYEIWYHKPSVFNADRWLPVTNFGDPIMFRTLLEAEIYADNEFAPVTKKIVKEEEF